jgi:glutaredoxin 3
MLTVYTKNNCPYCDRAKALLESRGVAYQTINLEEQPDARGFLVEQGLRSVPQIFNSETLLQGGYQGLVAQPEEFWINLKG